MSSNDDKVTFVQLLQSILAALIGVQSKSKASEIYDKITTGQLVLCAVILLVSFLASIITLVYFVLAMVT